LWKDFTLCSSSWLLSDLGIPSSELFLGRLTALLFARRAVASEQQQHITITELFLGRLTALLFARSAVAPEQQQR
jgi:hypothetical protein